MKSLIGLFIMYFFFISCQKKEIKIKLLNKQLYCKTTVQDSIKNFYNDCQYTDEKDFIDFNNIVRFEIVNHTDKGQLFFLNNLNLNEIYNLTIIIEDEKGNILEKSEPMIDPAFNCKLGSLIEHDYYNSNEKTLILKKMGYNLRSSINRYHNQEIVIQPQNSYVLYTSLPLPFVIEDNEDNMRRPIFYKFNPTSKYTFKLKYKLKDKIENVLSKEMIVNYTKNNIEIFKGEIETPRIPIVFRKQNR